MRKVKKSKFPQSLRFGHNGSSLVCTTGVKYAEKLDGTFFLHWEILWPGVKRTNVAVLPSVMFPSSDTITSHGVTPSSANSQSPLDIIKIDRSHYCPHYCVHCRVTAAHLYSVQCLDHVSPSSLLPNNLHNTKHAEHFNTELGTIY